MNDLDFLKWIYERMVEVHGENQNTDYMRRFRNILATMSCGSSKTFEEYTEKHPSLKYCDDIDLVEEAWDHQQQRIDDLEVVVKSAYMDGWHAGYKDAENDIPVAEYEPPKGYVVVPVEPTEVMLKVARNAPMPAVQLDSFTACSNLILKTQYKAMIQAAQES